MNLNKYPDMKNKGLVKMVKVGEVYALGVTKYDEAGNKLAPELVQVSREQLDAMRQQLRRDMDALEVVLADMDALDK
jgi:hypothetical protein